MATVKSFEQLEVWQLSRELARHIYALTKTPPLARDFGLRDQIRRAATSIMFNIAEGFERGGDKEFLQFLSLAKGSCGEVRAQLYVASDQGYIEQTEFEQLSIEAKRVSGMLSALMKYLRESELRGSKFK